MKKLFRTIICVMLPLCLFVRDADAQVVFGMKGEISAPFGSDASQAGVATAIGRQMKMSLLQADIGYCATSLHCDLSIFLRAYGNKEHSFNMYLGAGITGVAGLIKGVNNGFAIGLFPAIQAETFVSKRISLYADIRTPFLLKKEDVKGRALYSLGVRFLFNRESRDE